MMVTMTHTKTHNGNKDQLNKHLSSEEGLETTRTTQGSDLSLTRPGESLGELWEISTQGQSQTSITRKQRKQTRVFVRVLFQNREATRNVLLTPRHDLIGIWYQIPTMIFLLASRRILAPPLGQRGETSAILLQENDLVVLKVGL